MCQKRVLNRLIKGRTRMKRITGKRYDITGSQIGRVIKHFVISRFVKHEDFYGGPGFTFLVFAFIMHYFGRFYGWMTIRFERQTRFILNRIKPF